MVFSRERAKLFQGNCLMGGALVAIFALQGCSHGGLTSSLPLMKGKSVTSSQWEPDVDYEAEQQESGL